LISGSVQAKMRFWMMIRRSMKRIATTLRVFWPLVCGVVIFALPAHSLKVAGLVFAVIVALRFVYSLHSDRTSILIRFVQFVFLSLAAVLPWITVAWITDTLAAIIVAVVLAFDYYLRRTSTGPYEHLSPEPK
jgi:hypothetical protein